MTTANPFDKRPHGKLRSRATIVGVVQRLDAVGVAGQQQGFPGLVSEGEGEHAAQLVHHRRAPLGIEMQQHLGIQGSAVQPAVWNKCAPIINGAGAYPDPTPVSPQNFLGINPGEFFTSIT